MNALFSKTTQIPKRHVFSRFIATHVHIGSNQHNVAVKQKLLYSTSKIYAHMLQLDRVRRAVNSYLRLRGISVISRPIPLFISSSRVISTKTDTKNQSDESLNVQNKPTYHCPTCHYQSRMPIFICNSCNSLDPTGGTGNSSTSITDVADRSCEAVAKDAEVQETDYTPEAKCTLHNLLPCSICDPVAENAKHYRKNALEEKLDTTCDFFDFFQCPHKFNMDDVQLKQLTTRYHELQRVLHPDVYSANVGTTHTLDDLKDAERQSAAIAEAYRTLQDPYQRALYLLRLHGIDIERLSESQYASMAEGSRTERSSQPALEELQEQEQDMLFHVLEVRETLENSKDVLEISDILKSSKAQISECLEAMEASFEKRDLFRARHNTVLLNYLTKIQQEAENQLDRLQNHSGPNSTNYSL